MPTRRELVLRALEQGGGQVSVEAVRSRVEALYGQAPERGWPWNHAANVGARIEGDWFMRGLAEPPPLTQPS
jgi:hypothetical protein